MDWFLTSNDPSARVLRTIVQGVLAVIINYLTIIAAGLPEVWALLGVPVLMAVISPIMAELGKTYDYEEECDA